MLFLKEKLNRYSKLTGLFFLCSYDNANSILGSKIKCQCKNIINVLTIEIALERLGRKTPKYHCINCSSPLDEVRDWISGKREQDLVVSNALVKGFEFPIIIDAAVYVMLSSRSSGKLVKINCNKMLLDMLAVYNKFLKGSHDCQNIMIREKRQEINPSITELLGNLSKLHLSKL